MPMLNKGLKADQDVGNSRKTDKEEMVHPGG